MNRILLFIFLFVSINLSGQLTRILGPTPRSFSFFGEAVAMNENFAVAGQPATDASLNGPVYEKVQIYKRDQGLWQLHQTLSTTGNIFDETDFGGRLGMTERWLAASLDVGSSWRIRMYEVEADTFVLRQSLSAPEPYNGNFICKTIALTDEHLIVGGKEGRLFFYRYQNNSWELIQTITDNARSFGSAVAVQGNTCLVGSQLDSDIGTFQGAGIVFYFDGSQWRRDQKLFASDVGINHSMGSNVGLHKDVAAVTDFAGVYGGPEDESAVYLYRKEGSSWVEFQKLVSPSRNNRSNFGGSLLFTDKYLYIGANEDDRVYKFEKTDSTYNPISSVGGVGEFGESIALSGNTLMIGAPGFSSVRGSIYFTQVTENLVPIVRCMLPSDILGNPISEDEIGDAFISGNPNQPGEFGVLTIESFFERDDSGNLSSTGLCYTNDTITPQVLDFIKLDLPDNPDLEVTWEGSFEKDGQTYTAEDVLDDVHLLKPSLLLPIKSPMRFNVNFGAKGESPCATFPVNVYFVDFNCPKDTVQISIFAGNSIQLRADCQFNSPARDYGYIWESTGAPLEDRFVRLPRVSPLDTTLYTFSAFTGFEDNFCEVSYYIQVNPIKIDNDGDGFFNYEDCDDDDPNAFPGAPEIVGNDIDEDCDGIDEGLCHVRKPSREKGKDAMVWEGKGANYGGFPSLNLVTESGTNGSAVNKRIYIDFEMETIPLNAIIDSAFLTMHYNPDDVIERFDTHLGIRDMIVKRVIEPWNEDVINWATQPAVTSEDSLFIPTDRTDGSSTRGIINMDVTEMVVDMVTENVRHGFMLRLSEEEEPRRQLLFASSDHPKDSLHPELYVCWHLDSTSVSVDNFYKLSTLKIAPNPVNDFIQISNFGLTTEAALFSVSGKRETTFRLNKGKLNLDVSQLNSGIYFIKTGDGRVLKFIKN